MVIYKKSCFVIQRAYVTMDSHQEERISQLLGEMRQNESSNTSGTESGASTSACRDWYDAPHDQHCNEQPEGGSYNTDEGMLEEFLTCLLFLQYTVLMDPICGTMVVI